MTNLYHIKVPVHGYYLYEVWAESEEEAKNHIFNLDPDPIEEHVFEKSVYDDDVVVELQESDDEGD